MVVVAIVRKKLHEGEKEGGKEGTDKVSRAAAARRPEARVRPPSAVRSEAWGPIQQKHFGLKNHLILRLRFPTL